MLIIFLFARTCASVDPASTGVSAQSSKDHKLELLEKAGSHLLIENSESLSTYINVSAFINLHHLLSFWRGIRIVVR
jgi:hypothetical protein